MYIVRLSFTCLPFSYYLVSQFMFMVNYTLIYIGTSIEEWSENTMIYSLKSLSNEKTYLIYHILIDNSSSPRHGYCVRQAERPLVTLISYCLSVTRQHHFYGIREILFLVQWLLEYSFKYF